MENQQQRVVVEKKSTGPRLPSGAQVHCARFNDFVFGKLLLPPPPRAEGVRLLTVLDFGGLRLSTIRGNATAMK